MVALGVGNLTIERKMKQRLKIDDIKQKASLSLKHDKGPSRGAERNGEFLSIKSWRKKHSILTARSRTYLFSFICMKLSKKLTNFSSLAREKFVRYFYVPPSPPPPLQIEILTTSLRPGRGQEENQATSPNFS